MVAASTSAANSKRTDLVVQVAGKVGALLVLDGGELLLQALVLRLGERPGRSTIWLKPW